MCCAWLWRLQKKWNPERKLGNAGPPPEIIFRGLLKNFSCMVIQKSEPRRGDAKLGSLGAYPPENFAEFHLILMAFCAFWAFKIPVLTRFSSLFYYVPSKPTKIMLQANPILTFRYLCEEKTFLRLIFAPFTWGWGALGMLLNVCLLVLPLLFFENFAGAPYGQKYKYGIGAPYRVS